MITINGKTYKPTNAWHFSVQAILNDLIEKDCLEEVKENKETLGEICNLDTKPSDFSDYAHSQYNTSILEKLREELKKRIVFLDTVSTIGMENIRIKECEVFLDLLTSLETKEEPNLEEEFAKDFPNTWCQEQPQFTPGQEIEVSNDGEKWEKRTFQNMIKEKFQCWQTEEEHNKTTMFLKLWQFARPLEQVTIPEYKPPASIIYPNVGMEDIAMELSKGLIHLYELTHFLHSQFPNSKPK